MAGLREQKKQEVRARLLRVSERLFRRRGFDPTTVDEIARAARVSRQTFFNYFPSKEAVLGELGLAWLRGQAERTRAIPGRADAVQVLIGEQLAAVEKDRDFMRLVFTRSGAFFPHGPHVGAGEDRPRLDQTRAFFAAIAGLVATAQAEGRVRRDVPPEQVAEMYVAVLVTTTRLWLTDYWDTHESLVERGLRAVRVLEAGLRSER